MKNKIRIIGSITCGMGGGVCRTCGKKIDWQWMYCEKCRPKAK